MYDVVIIGAGVIGCAVARALSRFQISLLVIEKEEDVCCGTSKANSAIVHAGFDAEPGSRKAYFNVRGSQMMEALSRKLDFPYRKNTSLVVRNRYQESAVLRKLLAYGEQNGVKGLRIIDREELLRREPHLNEDAAEALLAPTGAIVDPFRMTIAFAESACLNGAEFHFGCCVQSIEKEEEGYSLLTNRGMIHTRTVVNCAGVFADELHNMVSEEKLQIIPRKGEYFLLDKTVGSYANATIFQLPGPMGKGVLVTPTVHGNLLVGPTAADIPDKDNTSTTAEGMAFLRKQVTLNMSDVPLRQVITSFAGLRATERGGDFVVGEAMDAPGFFDAAGIESPGLSSAPAIGDYLAEQICASLNLKEKAVYISERKDITDPKTLSIGERNRLIEKQPTYGNIVCRCETVTEGEIVEAIHRPIPARSLDGVKRRVRAGMGRCQGGFCSIRTMEILSRELGISMEEITKSGGTSRLISDRTRGEAEV